MRGTAISGTPALSAGLLGLDGTVRATTSQRPAMPKDGVPSVPGSVTVVSAAERSARSRTWATGLLYRYQTSRSALSATEVGAADTATSPVTLAVARSTSTRCRSPLANAYPMTAVVLSPPTTLKLVVIPVGHLLTRVPSAGAPSPYSHRTRLPAVSRAWVSTWLPKVAVYEPWVRATSVVVPADRSRRTTFWVGETTSATTSDDDPRYAGSSARGRSPSSVVVPVSYDVHR